MDFYFTRTYRGALKAAIFDWSGTTVDYGCFAPTVVFLEAFKKYGIEISMQQAREPMGMYKKDHLRAILHMPSVAQQWREVYGKYPVESDVDNLFADFIPLQMGILTDYNDLIPGLLGTVDNMRQRGMKIGTSTGYTTEMMAIVLESAKKQGYEPDSKLNASDVKQARPAPWMCYLNAMNLGVYPMSAYVKVGDTVQDILEGLNAGMWTIGITLSGNEVGLSLDEVKTSTPENLALRKELAAEKLLKAGAHYIMDSIEYLPPLLDQIHARLKSGERP